MMLQLLSAGAVLMFINFLGLRQASRRAAARPHDQHDALVDPVPAGPGALLGGWLGEHLGLRARSHSPAPRRCWWPRGGRRPVIRNVRDLPSRSTNEDWIGAEADVRAARQLADSV